MRRAALAVALSVLAVAAVALGGDSKTRIKGLGSAEVRWNGVPYRAELMKQLAPGLTWRLGKDGPTRLELSKLALVREGTILLPGEMTLNLRYWEQRNWELVVFEENDRKVSEAPERWKWAEDKKQYGTVVCHVGLETDPKRHSKGLELELRSTTKAARAVPPRLAVTGGDVEAASEDEDANEPNLSEKAGQDFAGVAVVEFHIRFGPHHALVSFDAVEPVALKGERPGREGGKPQKLALTYAAHPGVVARTEYLDEHEGELTLALWEKGAPGGQPVVLGLTGGEEPGLWPVRRQDGKELDTIWGRRIVTTATPKTVIAELEDNVLTIHLAKVDFVFEL